MMSKTSERVAHEFAEDVRRAKARVGRILAHGATISVRVNVDQLALVDQCVEEMRKREPGRRVTRSDGVRVLMLRGVKPSSPG